MGPKYLDISWDFREEDTKKLTHGIHPYPAMMIPQVAARLVSRYGAPDGILFDPYCGTGTSLLEANISGMDAVGTDLNPLARLIARVKTRPLEMQAVNDIINRLYAWMAEASHSPYNHADIPTFPNINYWFSKPMQRQLAEISSFISSIHSEDLRNFIKVAFSQTIRECSWTKNSEFKLVRMTEKQMKTSAPDAFLAMTVNLRRNLEAMQNLVAMNSPNVGSTSIYSFNTVTGIPEKVLPRNSVDLVVTSPPYGDSRTTVAYGQFSRLSNQWLGFPNANKVDQLLMGGNRRAGQPVKFGFKVLDDAIAEIASQDAKRATEVISFFIDYRRSIKNVASVLKESGHACYVVGNRTVRGVQIPMEEATATLFEMAGFDHIESIQRNIPNKRMPYKNSPTNTPGMVANTMKSEFVTICRKRTRYEARRTATAVATVT